MRMRNAMRALALLVMAVALAPAAPAGAAVAACPTECRRELAEVMCREEVIESGDRTTTARYYWSNGAD